MSEPQMEHLQAVIDDMQVSHETTLLRIDELRGERDRLLSALTVFALYSDSLHGRNELNSDALLGHVERYIEEFKEAGWM